MVTIICEQRPTGEGKLCLGLGGAAGRVYYSGGDIGIRPVCGRLFLHGIVASDPIETGCQTPRIELCASSQADSVARGWAVGGQGNPVCKYECRVDEYS